MCILQFSPVFCNALAEANSLMDLQEGEEEKMIN